MTAEEKKVGEWYCKECSVFNGGDSDAISEDSTLFKNVKLVHEKHKGWQKGKPKIKELLTSCQNCREDKHDKCTNPDRCRCSYFKHRVPLTSCQNCSDNKHDKCTNPDRCRCSYYKHKDDLQIGVKVNFDKPVNVDNFNDDVKDANAKINQEPKVFHNKNYDLVADIIQSENNFLTFRENKEMWNYNKDEGIYKPLAHTIIEESCQRMIQKCKRSAVLEVVDTIRRNKTMIYMKDLLESDHINTQNGILDPKFFVLKPHSPEYLTYTKLPFAVNFNARNLKLWNHILTIIDVKDINLLMELIWIGISWNNPFKKMFVFKGETNTQKSTLADILVWIIGNANVSREKPDQYLSKGSRFSTSKFIGKRMNIASEIGNFTEQMIENQNPFFIISKYS